CFLMILPMSVVAIYITMAERILYPAYAAAPRITSLSPFDDQLLGGLIMWIPGGLIFILIMTVVFFKWASRGEDGVAAAQVDWKRPGVII
ncbi:MAG: cytochrome c oxidase assembly protein, partial [Gemmatimonadaceae bacterium]